MTIVKVLEYLHPSFQIVLEADHSSDHLQRDDDNLNVANMNLGVGGKQIILRDTTLSAGCFGHFQEYVASKADGTPVVYKRLLYRSKRSKPGNQPIY
jgi:hypothetical protein